MTGKKEKASEKREKRLQEISLLRTIPYSDHQRWWSEETIAIVTGANRGIGFEIAKQLAGHGLTVILTSRDTSVGIEAAKVLQEGGFNVDVHQLDILHEESISEFTKWIKEKYDGVDILVNNAGVNYNLVSGNSMEYAKQMIETNYFGTKNMIKAMIPLMRPSAAGARIVNVSSRLGKLNGRRSRIEDEALREKLSNLETLSEELIDNMVSTFLQQVEADTWQSGGWPQKFTDYAVSKLAVNLYSMLMAKQLSERPEEHAADTGVWLALLPNEAVTGKLFAERRELKV
ncbi:(+)-neomenthol dehydrogenase [Gossypium arboreum]|uniref:(+)-neomenthol dehydrogenase n=1 Tax=Gossypium arboreum TaxID=29729 RepID=A0A0B0PUL9_GOSAR|nr:(+)-neomenthol dehydrogenase [Gossypium arboreum]